MKFINFDSVLCLSPHPDDSEIGISGSVMCCSETNFDIICLSKGGAKNYDVTNKLNRRKEVDLFWKESNCKNVTVRHSAYDYLEDAIEYKWISYIEKNFMHKRKYDCILVPSKKDSNYDHRIVNNFAFSLCRFSKTSIIEYQTFSTLNNWIPNLFLDIEKKFKLKLESLRKFKSQKNKPYFNKKSLICFHKNFQCSKKNLQKVEKYKIIEILT